MTELPPASAPGPNSAALTKTETDEVSRRCINAGRVDWLRDLGIDLVMGYREGEFIWDLNGTRYIDALCDGTTYNYGHRNTRLIEVLTESLRELDIGCQFLPSPARANLANQLVQNSPAGLNHVHFLPSGSEANDAAIKCAMAATGRRRIVSIKGGFYGVTGLAARATGNTVAGAFDLDTSDRIWAQVSWNDAEAITGELSSGDVAAVLLETIPATLGWPLPAPGYLQSVRDACSQFGTMMIVDEAQTGLGRCGYLWAIDHWGVKPDIMVMAKGAGGGIYPLAYILMNDAAASWTHDAPLVMPSTFGGSEIGCIVGLEVLKIAKDKNMQKRIARKSQILREGLTNIESRHSDSIEEIRHLGLAAAIKFKDATGGLKMMSALFENGVLAMAASYDQSVVQLKPALTIGDPALHQLLTALDNAIADCPLDSQSCSDPDLGANRAH